MFFRRKTTESHAKSVQNIRKLLFSLEKTKEKQKKKKTPPKKKKKNKQNRPSKMCIVAVTCSFIKSSSPGSDRCTCLASCTFRQCWQSVTVQVLPEAAAIE